MPELSAQAIAKALAQAETEAQRGHRGANPLVGAVVLAPDGTPVSTGFHRGAGHPHAEVDALARLPHGWRARASELTLVVTLEPCRLTGRTGPCVAAIRDAGIGSVLFAAADGTVNGGGGGGEELRTAGVAVSGPLDPDSAQRLNSRWLSARAQSRPFVTAHLAQSLDARVADSQGRGRWITGPEAREHAHRVRSRVDTIVVGTGTVLADDPALSVRLPGVPDRFPPVVVAGERGVPDASQLGARQRAGGAVAVVSGRDPLAVLAACQGGHVLLEGGPTLLSAFLEADLVDELFLYVAPSLLGPGTDATAALTGRTVSAPLRLDHDPAGLEPDRLGRDLLLHLLPAA